MGKPNSLPTFSANLLTWRAARWLPRSLHTNVRAAPPTLGASLFDLQFAPPPCATESAVPFSTSSLHHSLQVSASLSIVLPPGPSYARSAARLVGVVCHHHRLEKGSSRTERSGLCDENHTGTNTMVVLHGYHTGHLFRLAFVSTKRTVDNRTRHPSSSSLWLSSLAK